MKALKWIAWISGGIGLIFMLLGAISGVFGGLLAGVEVTNYFHVANSFFLITIALFIYMFRCQCKKE